ncbi:lysozyme family protein [Enterococcus faecalis]|uniref:bifunctional lytic transglycosylase/C40 family peptidase n=1 Tax=Enterococcus faecalis TaxID=1351 RepID=UPI003F80B378
MKLLKLKFILLLGSLFMILFGLIFCVTLFFSDDDSSAQDSSDTSGLSVSKEVLSHKNTVEKYCKEYDISKYVHYILAIMQVESGGKGQDVMQSSESLGLPPNTLSTEESIKQGCKYFSELLKSSNDSGCDVDSAIQSYNYGGGFLQYVASRGKKYSYELAENFSKEKSGGTRVSYPNPIAIPINGGWRFNYGNQFYVKLVSQYLTVTEFDNKMVQAIMDEALKYQGYPYVFGGASPETSFDCSGLTLWCFGKAGITLPRIAQAQYDATQHIPLTEAKAGDLVFFHSTYDTSDYVTHVGIVVSPTQMYHAGDPIGYGDLTSSYWQQHLIGAGRIITK